MDTPAQVSPALHSVAHRRRPPATAPAVSRRVSGSRRRSITSPSARVLCLLEASAPGRGELHSGRRCDMGVRRLPPADWPEVRGSTVICGYGCRRGIVCGEPRLMPRDRWVSGAGEDRPPMADVPSCPACVLSIRDLCPLGPTASQRLKWSICGASEGAGLSPSRGAIRSGEWRPKAGGSKHATSNKSSG
jgi:hypothetical protein